MGIKGLGSRDEFVHLRFVFPHGSRSYGSSSLNPKP